MKYEKPELELVVFVEKEICTIHVSGPNGTIDSMEGGEF